MAQRYIVALGSNQRHHRHGNPARVIAAALAALYAFVFAAIHRVCGLTWG